MDRKRLQQLLDRYQQGKATREELNFLESYYAFFDRWPAGKDLTEEELQNERQEVLERLYREMQDKEPAPIVPLLSPARRRWWMAAAVMALLIIGGIIFWMVSRPSGSLSLATTTAVKDFAPGKNGAVLTLSNGQKIVLDSVGDGELAKDASVAVIKTNGTITYRGKTAEIVYNTITTNRGRQWQLVLPDGSKVWLNAASSIRYPVAFTGSSREVTITGEAYFEVKHDTKKPFRVYINTVSGNGGMIEDLGTAFNVNAYGDEVNIKTTLLEGSVRVTKGGSNALIKPGQQASFPNPPSGDGGITVSHADVDQAVAWKNGVFQFDHADLKSVMRQLSRWYDVEVKYEGPVPERQFGGKISRYSNASEVLRVLELSKVHFKINNKTIIVMP
jgi:ferric-dicitrate binding protein FerR (iron transport regulator)